MTTTATMATQTKAETFTAARKMIRDTQVVRVSVEVGSGTFAQIQISKREATDLVRAAEEASDGRWVAITELRPGLVVIGRLGF